MPALDAIRIAPLKGARLQTLPHAVVGPVGIRGDRAFFLVDESGAMVSADALPSFLQVDAAHDPETQTLTVHFPGQVVEDSVATSLETVEALFYGHAVPGVVVDGPFAEAFSSFFGRRLRLVRPAREGGGIGDEPVTLVGAASVRELGARGRHEGTLDPRRFRINLELEGLDPFEEDTWRGRRVRVGGAVLHVVRPIARCVITTLDPESGRKDFDTLTQIAKFRPRIDGDGGLPFGMYARVEVPGEVSPGDRVEPLPE